MNNVLYFLVFKTGIKLIMMHFFQCFIVTPLGTQCCAEQLRSVDLAVERTEDFARLGFGHRRTRAQQFCRIVQRGP